MDNQQVRVHSFESLGTYDGPGLRLVVFLQGCNFQCLYCANPDTIDFNEGEITNPERIIEMAKSQKPFFGKKGGITFSGGEPTVQAKTLVPLFRRLKDEGIHICVDTNGSVWNEYVKDLFLLTDLVLLDVKQINPTRHKHLTGCNNEQTLKTAAWLEEQNKPFWLRYVYVQGISADEEDVRALCEHFKEYKNLQRIEILPYHTLGVHKYEAMGLEYKLKNTKENTVEQLETVKKIFDEYFPVVYLN